MIRSWAYYTLQNDPSSCGHSRSRDCKLIQTGDLEAINNHPTFKMLNPTSRFKTFLTACDNKVYCHPGMHMTKCKNELGLCAGWQRESDHDTLLVLVQSLVPTRVDIVLILFFYE